MPEMVRNVVKFTVVRKMRYKKVADKPVDRFFYVEVNLPLQTACHRNSWRSYIRIIV